MGVAFVETGMLTGVSGVGAVPEAWRSFASKPPGFQTGFATIWRTDRVRPPESLDQHETGVHRKVGLLTPRDYGPS